MHRVVLWGTGFVGKAVLKSLIGHPAFELAGVLVHDPAKDGSMWATSWGRRARG